MGCEKKRMLSIDHSAKPLVPAINSGKMASKFSSVILLDDGIVGVLDLLT